MGAEGRRDSPSRQGKITNIANADQLLRYAAQAQLAKIGSKQTRIAEITGQDRAAITKKIQKLTVEYAKKLDTIIIALKPEMDRPGGLASLAVRLRGLEDAAGLSAQIPAPWTKELLKSHAEDEFAVLIQASGVLSLFMALQSRPGQAQVDMTEIVSRYREEIRKLVDRLIIIGGSPPTPRNIDALVLLGSLGAYAFDLADTGLRTGLERAIRTKPLGFRAWRAVSKTVRISKSLGLQPAGLKDWVQVLIEDAEDLRERSLYPARSLDLELALNVPKAWSPSHTRGLDWAGAALLNRAENTDASLRERGTAALGAWERALREGRDPAPVKERLEVLISSFTDEAKKPGASAGPLWVAATLRSLLTTGVGVCNAWPEGEAPCRIVVRDTALELQNAAERIPLAILPDTITLVEHALLQNQGVHRREAIDTLSAGGWATPVARALETVLIHKDSESWLRCRALFALGFLNVRDSSVSRILKDACIKAYYELERLEKEDLVSKPQTSELHAALFAVGDCFGATGAEAEARDIRHRLERMLQEIVHKSKHRHSPSYVPVLRATAYLLVVTAQPQIGAEEDLSHRLLTELSKDADEPTADLSRWALGFRFGPGGTIRPLHHAPLYPSPDA
ncbi:hypothetical protein SAMN05444920_14712 [Nonomuraea solani]|uniref:Uncharacterized protein n=1 Tax=Nonomuraea solani TaxID=1144553 RepID=A0A1H6F3R8_9ACTN|nr:hypothetical protein [Nonomuraea solani]SEH03889.1 hypothetical protein SAMN05444920_14712 [Nonomuraea solani]